MGEDVQRGGVPLGGEPGPETGGAGGHEQRAIGAEREGHGVGEGLEAADGDLGGSGGRSLGGAGGYCLGGAGRRGFVPEDGGEQGPLDVVVERLGDLLGRERVTAQHAPDGVGAQGNGATEPAAALLLPQAHLLVDGGVDVGEHALGGDLQSLDQHLALADEVRGEALHPPGPGEILPDAVGLDELGGVDAAMQDRGGEAQRVGRRGERLGRTGGHDALEDVVEIGADSAVHFAFELSVLTEGGEVLEQAATEGLAERIEVCKREQRDVGDDIASAQTHLRSRAIGTCLTLVGGVHGGARLLPFEGFHHCLSVQRDDVLQPARMRIAIPPCLFQQPLVSPLAASPPATLTAMAKTRMGVLTGGGDCPGLNAAIRAVTRSGTARGYELVGFRNGWAGVLEDAADALTLQSTAGILPRGGTILGTSRTNPYANDADGTAAVRATLERRELQALVAIGGEDTLGVALKLHADGVPVVGVPKTIDNDLGGTDATIGFDTAVQIVADAIDRLHSTAESHNRVMVVEVMGRHAGWIAVHAGMAGGADAILVPERRFDIEEVCARLRRRHERGRSFSIVVVAEGAIPQEGTMQTIAASGRDAFGHERLGGIGVSLEPEIEQRTGFQTRATILGHVQRGGSPTAFDRVLATRLGVGAMAAVAAGRNGVMVGIHAGGVVEVPLQQALREPKLLDPALYETAELFFG
jgi:phosphofructokinase-like protein